MSVNNYETIKTWLSSLKFDFTPFQAVYALISVDCIAYELHGKIKHSEKIPK